MMSAKEAEAEWIDNKARVKSIVVSEDPGKKEREELKQRIEKLTESVKAANLQTKPAVLDIRSRLDLLEQDDRT